MKTPNNPDRLRHILDAIGKIEKYLHGYNEAQFFADDKTQDAIIRQLQNVGEAAKNLTTDVREANPQIIWKQVMATRDRLAHGYYLINLQIIWDTTQNDLPKLKTEITKILEKLNEEEN